MPSAYLSLPEAQMMPWESITSAQVHKERVCIRKYSEMTGHNAFIRLNTKLQMVGSLCLPMRHLSSTSFLNLIMRISELHQIGAYLSLLSIQRIRITRLSFNFFILSGAADNPFNVSIR